MRADAVAGVLRGAVRAVRAPDADDPAPAGAGDRARAGHRHRRRLPARRRLRSRGRGRQRALRGERRQPRPLLLVAERAARRATSPRKPAFEMLVTGEFISADEARASGLVNRVASIGSARRRGRVAGRGDRRQAARRDRARQGALLSPARDAAVEAAYEDAGRTMACNMMERRRARRRAGLHRQAQARLADAERRRGARADGLSGQPSPIPD